MTSNHDQMQEREQKEAYMRQVADLREDLARLNLLLEEQSSQLSLNTVDDSSDSEDDMVNSSDPFSTPLRHPEDKAMVRILL